MKLDLVRVQSGTTLIPMKHYVKQTFIMLLPCIFLCCIRVGQLVIITHFSPTISWFCFIICLAIQNEARSSLLLNVPSKAFLLATNTVCFVTFLALAQSSVLPSFFHNLLFSVISSLMELSHHMSSHSICPFLTNHKLSVAERTLFKIFPYVINIIRIIYPVICKKIM